MLPQLTARPSDIPLDNLYNLLEPIKCAPNFANWARTFRCTPLAVFEPESEFQVELVLELARREGRAVRAVGVGHSPSDLACTSQYMLRMTKLNRVLEVRFPLSEACPLTRRFLGQHRKAIRRCPGRHHAQ